MDPRIHTSMEDLTTLHDAQVAMAAALDSVAKADLAAHAVEEQLNAGENASLTAELAPYREAVERLLHGAEHARSGEASGEEREKQMPGIDEVTGETGQLYGVLTGSDEPATAVVLDDSTQAEADAKQAVSAWQDFLDSRLPALNDVMRKAGKPAISVSQAPTNMPEGGDED